MTERQDGSQTEAVPPLFAMMTFRVQICGNMQEDRLRFRRAYEDAERFMFGEEGTPREYVAVLTATLESEESLR